MSGLNVGLSGGYKWLKEKGITEEFPYIENGVEGVADSLHEIYCKALFSYETFEIVERTSRCYSLYEQRNIANIIRFQQEVGAYYAPFQSESEERKLWQLKNVQIKERLNKAYKKNKGIYYVTGLSAFTSSVLYESPELIPAVGSGAGMPRRKRLFGDLEDVVAKTLELYDGTPSYFCYPYLFDGKRYTSKDIYSVYFFAFQFSDRFELLDDRKAYSSQEKKIIKQLMNMEGPRFECVFD